MRVRTTFQGVALIATFFLLLPRIFVALNERAGWPRWENPLADVVGGVLVASGIGVILYSSRLFRRAGKGTLIPSEPAGKLILTGLLARWSWVHNCAHVRAHDYASRYSCTRAPDAGHRIVRAHTIRRRNGRNTRGPARIRQTSRTRNWRAALHTLRNQRPLSA